MHLAAIGGSDAGISAALRARELDSSAEVTVVVSDAYPNFSICGIPYYISGEVTHWRNLAHRTIADLETTGMQLRLDTVARRIEVGDHKLLIADASGGEQLIAYDKLLVGTGAVPVQPRSRACTARTRSAPPTESTCCIRWGTPSRSCAPWRKPHRPAPSSSALATSGWKWRTR